MSFLEAIFKCLKKYTTFKGRASRSEYWWFTVLVLLFEWPLALTTFGGNWFTQMLSFIYFTLTLAVIIPHMAVWTRRMHDVNKSGWSWLFIFLPIIGWFIIFRRLTKEGDAYPNRFGDPDNGPRTPQNLRTTIEPQDLLNETGDNSSQPEATVA